MELLFRGHFHVNAADKAGARHSMQRWEVSPSGDFLPPTLF